MRMDLSRPAPLRARAARLPFQLFALLLACCVGAVNAQAQDTLGFDQALSLAQTRSRQLLAQDKATAAARDMAQAAGQRPDPILKVGVNNLPLDGADRFSVTRDFMTMRSIGVMQEFTREDKRLARSRRFEAEAQASEASRTLAQANLQRDTALAWLERHYLERMLTLVQAQREEVRLQIDAADAAYRGGKGSQAEVISAHAALAQMDERMAQAAQQVSTAKTQLARWTGEPTDKPLGPLPDMGHVRWHGANPASEWAGELSSELADHFELAVMRKQEEMTQADADMARANEQADWSVEFMLSQRGPGYSNMASLNASIPLQWDHKNRQGRELAAKQALAEQARAQREEATRDHLAQVTALLQAWQSGCERLQRYGATLIPLALERTRATVTAYRSGASNSTLAAVLEARRMELDTRMEHLRLEWDTARVWTQLTFLIPSEHGVASSRP